MRAPCTRPNLFKAGVAKRVHHLTPGSWRVFCSSTQDNARVRREHNHLFPGPFMTYKPLSCPCKISSWPDLLHPTYITPRPVHTHTPTHPHQHPKHAHPHPQNTHPHTLPTSHHNSSTASSHRSTLTSSGMME